MTANLEENGQGMLEYALILILVAIIILIVLYVFGISVGNLFSNIISNV